MDPNATLAQMMSLVETIHQTFEEDGGDHIDPYDAENLASLVEALNDWIMEGGSLPRAWQRK